MQMICTPAGQRRYGVNASGAPLYRRNWKHKRNTTIDWERQRKSAKLNYTTEATLRLFDAESGPLSAFRAGCCGGP